MKVFIDLMYEMPTLLAQLSIVQGEQLHPPQSVGGSKLKTGSVVVPRTIMFTENILACIPIHCFDE